MYACIFKHYKKDQGEMGCRLPKLRKAEERQSPGKIYSTLRRPQVETKVGVAYTYHFLDFLLGKEDAALQKARCRKHAAESTVTGNC
ncbi:unnamed protein product [Boreogadus saida]